MATGPASTLNEKVLVRRTRLIAKRSDEEQPQRDSNPCRHLERVTAESGSSPALGLVSELTPPLLGGVSHILSHSGAARRRKVSRSVTGPRSARRQRRRAADQG